MMSLRGNRVWIADWANFSVLAAIRGYPVFFNSSMSPSVAHRGKLFLSNKEEPSDGYLCDQTTSSWDAQELKLLRAGPVPLSNTGIVRGVHIAFAEKHSLLSWAHKLTKNRSLAFLPLFCVCLCSKPYPLQSLCNCLEFQK
jgi:hypothetical protein